MNLLVVDDEKDIADLIAWNLEREGYSVSKAHDGEEALNSIRAAKPDLIVLDLMLPGLSGLEICQFVRKDPKTADIPIIMLTAKTDEVDKVIGLEIGADDYMTKPFSIRELLARIRAVLRRSKLSKREDLPEEGNDFFQYKGLQINYRSYEVLLNGAQINLSPTEMKIIILLTKNPGRVFTREEILNHIWGDQSFVEPRTVDVHIRRLRQQLEQDTEKPEFIITVRGIGYKLSANH